MKICNSGADRDSRPTGLVRLSILIPIKNESMNITRCLTPLLGWADEIVVVDSQSSDGTIETAESLGATVIQFHYDGGWPKKRQWALENHPWRNDWILLLDSDEILSDRIKAEIASAIKEDRYHGFWLRFRTVFLGHELRFGDSDWWKLSLFRKGLGRFEQRTDDHDTSNLDMEVHEHVIVNGRTGRLRSPVRHENYNSLYRYIEKHNGYSNWEAKVLSSGRHEDQIKPSLFGNQAQRRRWLKQHVLALPGSPILRFLYVYFFRFGFLDGKAGFMFSVFKGIQMFHVKAKICEQPVLRQRQSEHDSVAASVSPIDSKIPIREVNLSVSQESVSQESVSQESVSQESTVHSSSHV